MYPACRLRNSYSLQRFSADARFSLGRSLVGMRSILSLSVCPSGLRVGRIFGLFCHDFFIPLNSITVIRKERALWKVAKLSFGQPPIGNLTIPSEVADRIARAAGTLAGTRDLRRRNEQPVLVTNYQAMGGSDELRCRIFHHCPMAHIAQRCGGATHHCGHSFSGHCLWYRGPRSIPASRESLSLSTVAMAATSNCYAVTL
jgi:hypothetical protein